MDFINIYENCLSEEVCSLIIKHTLEEYSDFKESNSYNLLNTIDTYPVHEDDDFWKKEFTKIKNIADRNIENFLSFSNLNTLKSYNYNHSAISCQIQGRNIPIHYDNEIDYAKDNLRVRNFAVLIYLNDNFEGGELVFPIQKVIIKPKVGMMVIFPTSFMHPHITTPNFIEDRFVLRLNYYFNKELLEINYTKNRKLLGKKD